MQSINVSLKDRSYAIQIQNGLRLRLHEILGSENSGQQWIIFSQKPIFDIYGDEIESMLREHKFNVKHILLENSENAKSLSSMEAIYSQLISFGCDRTSVFLALGGGVVGDTTGFAAATFMRGVDYYQIPTTLLAMVDSSIGGKTGVNLDAGKNLVGAIWQPSAVLIDPAFLDSLPKREVISALGEVIKYGAILDSNFFNDIAENLDELLGMANPLLLGEIIGKCAALKAEIIEQDEREGDLRRILNFGHTIGHALEKYFGFEVLRHGEAVSYGMLAAAKLSIEFGGLSFEDNALLEKTILRLPLPPLPEFDVNEIVKIMATDKKVKDGSINFILLSKIGETVIVDNIDNKMLLKTLKLIQ
ncbi:MAG: 3-dehydroquinate synthase [Candidatus Marinimicrobia bacterium]|nr:3-dehydroquinate synthase [Candidatus Neomarinimicrobiota bacterium]